MNLEDISNIYQKSLNSFFRNKQIINLIYTEQFGKKYTDYEEELKKKYGEEYFKHDVYYKEYMHILDNTVFIPYITLKDLDRMLINERASFVSKYLEENPEENESLNEYLTEESEKIKQNTIKEYSSFLLNDLKELFPNLTEEQYSKTLKLCSNIEITALEHLIPDLTEDYEYSEILKHCSNIDSNENAKFIELDTLKQLLPTLTKKQYSTILKHCSNIAAQSITDEFFSGKKSLFPKSKKSKKLKAEKIIEKNIEDKDTKIYKKTLYLRIAAEKEYGSEYMESNFSKELDLSKKLNTKKRDIIKKYSSFMLDDLKEFFPGLTKDEYSKILNITFYEKDKSIEDELFKNKTGFFTKFKQSKVEKIIEKYKKLTDEKILMETSSFYKHLSDVPKGKYYTDILEKISSGTPWVTQSIGRKTDKNIRYIFLPVFTYQTKKDYLKAALHEVMHISKEHLSRNHYQSGFVVRDLPKNPLDSTLKINHTLFSDLRDLWQKFKWSKIAKRHNLPSQHQSYNSTNGTMSAEEVIHHLQSREVLKQIVNNDDLIKLLDLPYINKSFDNPPTQQYELFDGTTKKFIKRFKTDIQNVNNGELSVKKFKRKVGIRNFALFAQTANLCTNDNNTDNNIISLSSLSFANLISDSDEFPDNQKYNRIGNDVVEKMKAKVNKMEIRRAAKIEKRTKRQAFIEKTKDKIASMNIFNTGKSIESEVKNRAKNISNEPTR